MFFQNNSNINIKLHATNLVICYNCIQIYVWIKSTVVFNQYNKSHYVEYTCAIVVPDAMFIVIQ